MVDDDETVRHFVSGSSASSGNNYNVLTAASGAAGLQQSRDYEGEIHLLLSDFQMPQMSGIDLATAISLERPDIRVMLMSGFPAGMLLLNEGWHFLAKPFVPSQLNAMVRNLLDLHTPFETSEGHPQSRGTH